MLSDFSGILLLSLLVTLCSDVKTYTQISSYGSRTQDSGPKIFKATNSDIVFPQTHNSSNYVISTTQIPLIATTSPTIPVHYAKDSASDTALPATPATPVIYVTPPSQTSFTQNAHNSQPMETNQMQVGAQSDYAKQLLQEETYRNIQTNDNQQLSSTGRAVDYRPAYQLDQFMNVAKPYTTPVRPYVLQPTTRYPIRPYKGQATQYSGINVRPYPQSSYHQHQRPQQLLRRPPSQAEVYKLNGRGQISDRFTPGEAVASALFTKNAKKHGHNHNHGSKATASSNLLPSYVAPKDLYSFPPNVNAKYPKPSEDAKAALASINVNSYVPPAAGPIKAQADYPLTALASTNEGYQYNGPVNPAYLPPSDGQDEKTKETNVKPSESNSADADSEDNDDTIGVLPASAMDTDESGSKVPNEESDMTDEGGMNMMPMGEGDHDHNHDHSADHPPMSYDSDKEYPTPPPGWMEEHPEHGHGPSFPYFPHHFPEIIYDDHHHDFHHDFHHDHHHPVEPPLPTTTIPPPPEPLPSEQPQEPRVKKYSYFYIGRKLWYIPLYFTVWFSFYVLWLILKSIARHKVNLPNHYVAKRSMPNALDKKTKEQINDLTVYVLQNIENFQKKYIT